MDILDQLRAVLAAAEKLHPWSRRYCDMRMTYAPGEHNDATRTLLKLGADLHDGDGTLYARDGMGRLYDGLTDAEAAVRPELDRWERWSNARLIAAWAVQRGFCSAAEAEARLIAMGVPVGDVSRGMHTLDRLAADLLAEIPV